MQTLIFNKSTKIILQSRVDNSTGEKMPKEQVLQTHCEDNNLDIQDFEIVEIPFTKFNLEIGKQIYNKETNSIEINPNWIAPPALEVASIPVTNPSGGA
jgi:hypothetical protein